jgi:hypothetical protein
VTRELTAKQWERRALTAEQELETIRTMRKQDSERDLTMARENAALRVALREIQEASNWAYGMIADTLKGSK